MALVKIHGITKEYPEGTTWMEVAREHQKAYEYDILLVRVNGKLQELHKQKGFSVIATANTSLELLSLTVRMVAARGAVYMTPEDAEQLYKTIVWQYGHPCEHQMIPRTWQAIDSGAM